MITVRALEKVYRDDGVATAALRGLTLDIAPGEFIAITGPSGSGKSTLLHILSFLDRPTGGSYTFFGNAIDTLSDRELAHIRNKQMGFVFQAFNLLGRATVYHNVELPLLYADVASPLRRGMVERAVESVGLAEKIGQEAGTLSGGQRQRVAIARALVNDPDVLFADEPTGNLDSKSGAAVMEILKRLNDQGRTVILVTHETYTAEFARRMITMRDGMIESDVPIEKRVDGASFFK